ncbi:aminodeoxychorismate synthase, component I [Rhodothermaceae bacterium RA]|nr:aminodeoxychorismate synthase, component I [Rhodothermaceae bacterium RA]
MPPAPGTVLLDTIRPDAENRTSLLFTEPVRVLTAASPAEVPALLARLDDAVGAGYYVAGYLSYEAGLAFEPAGAAAAAESAEPVGWFGVYETPEPLDADAVVRWLATAGVGHASVGAFSWSPEAYRDRLRAIRHHIREGDVYQINFTGQVAVHLHGDPLGLYRTLRARQRVPYAAYLHTGRDEILSLSPELFFRREGRRIWTRPMKGTIRRGQTSTEDAALRRHLAEDAKSRAENLMIVDLLRNDLSRVCEPGTVHVPALFATEVYETLIQMTSTVEGRLAAGTSYAALFRALFPCGSVTGAPRLRAMALIRALEAGPRGVYCGAIGYAGPDDRAVFNVAIRTLTVRDGAGRLGIGSGIVWDSDPDQEYAECQLKARFLAPEADRHPGPFHLIETMRWADGIALLDLHADRIATSARFFDVPFDPDAFRRAVAAATEALAPGTAHRVRVTLDAGGRLHLTTAPLAPMPDRPLRVVLAETPVDATDVFLFHKTTHRRLYETAYQRARDAGFDEVLFLNEHGHLTEGSRSNVFLQHGGRLLTPPVGCGLLAGVYRRHVLDTHPDAAEQVLTLDDLARTERLFLCNAVWGLREARLVTTERLPLSPLPTPTP